MSVSWNPWHGCRKLSEGCRHCYVYRQDAQHDKDSREVRRTAAFNLPVRRTRDGRYNIKRAQFKHDFGPLEEGCDCYTCTHYSRAYVDHALRAREFNGFTLATIHNEHFFVKLLDDIRASIDGGYFDEFRDEALARFYANGSRG